MDDIIVTDMLGGKLPDCNIYIGAEFVIDQYSHAAELKNGTAEQAIKEAEGALDSLEELISNNERIRTSQGIVNQLGNVRTLRQEHTKLAESQARISQSLKQRLRKQPELQTKNGSVYILKELVKEIAEQVSSKPSDEAIELGAQTLASALIENKDTVLLSRNNELAETIQATYFLLTQKNSPLCLMHPEILKNKFYLGNTVAHTSQMFGTDIGRTGSPVKYQLQKPDKEYDFSGYMTQCSDKLHDLRNDLERALTRDRLAYVEMVNGELELAIESRDSLRGRISDKAGETEKYRTEVAVAKDEAARIGTELEQARADLDVRRLEYEAAQSRIVFLDGQKDSVSADYAKLQQENGELVSAHAELESAVLDLRNQNQALTSQTERTESTPDLNAALDKIRVLETRAAGHYSLVREIRSEYEERDQRAFDLQKEVEAERGKQWRSGEEHGTHVAELTASHEQALADQRTGYEQANADLREHLEAKIPTYPFATEYRTHDEDRLPELNIGVTLKGKYMEFHLPFRRAKGELNQALAEAARTVAFMVEDEHDNYRFECALPYEEYISECVGWITDAMREQGHKAKIVLKVNDLR